MLLFYVIPAYFLRSFILLYPVLFYNYCAIGDRSPIGSVCFYLDLLSNFIFKMYMENNILIIVKM